MTTERRWKELNIAEQFLVYAARQTSNKLGRERLSINETKNAARGLKMAACQRFLEAHGPEYADVRAWRLRKMN